MIIIIVFKDVRLRLFVGGHYFYDNEVEENKLLLWDGFSFHAYAALCVIPFAAYIVSVLINCFFILCLPLYCS